MNRLYIIIILLLLMSCSDFLKEYSQDLAYVRSYEDLDQLLMGNGYMKVKPTSRLEIGTDYYPYVHFMADETEENISNSTDNPVIRGTREIIFGYYTWQQRVGVDVQENKFNAENKDWDQLYYHINIVNMVITAIEEQEGKTAQERVGISRVKGEAYFLRAAYYFTLVNLYGKPYTEATSSTDLGVPIKVTGYIEDVKYQRNSVAEVYKLVIEDLAMAEKCLEGVEHKSIYRADIHAVHLLQSRVYLYMQQWVKARSYAEQVLKEKNALIDLNHFDPKEADFLNVSSVENIFSMGRSIMASNIGQMVPGNFGVSEDLYNSFQTDADLRKEFFVKKGKVHIDYLKTTVRSGRVSVSDNFLFRTAEAWLNLAEASAMNGDEPEAYRALEMLRQHRIKSDEYMAVALSGEKLINYIREERRRELCFEGHRWFDLRRYMVCEKYPYAKTLRNSYTSYIYNSDSYNYIPKETRIYELQLNDQAYTLPIPTEVLEYNDGMKNNVREERKPTEVINR